MQASFSGDTAIKDRWTSQKGLEFWDANRNNMQVEFGWVPGKDLSES